MTLRPTLIALATALIGALGQAPAEAALVTYGYTGVVDSDDAARGYSGFSGQFSFDTSALDQIPDPQTADYPMGFWPLGMNVVFDGGAASLSINDRLDLLVSNDLGNTDSLGVLARTSDLSTSLGLTLDDFTASVFSSDSLPGGGLSLALFGWGSFRWEGADGLLSGHLTGLSCLGGCDAPGNGDGGTGVGGDCPPGPAPCPTGLPEPATPVLSAFALMAAGWTRARTVPGQRSRSGSC